MNKVLDFTHFAVFSGLNDGARNLRSSVPPVLQSSYPLFLKQCLWQLPGPSLSCGLAEPLCRVFSPMSQPILCQLILLKTFPSLAAVSHLNKLPGSRLHSSYALTAVFSSCISVFLSFTPSLKCSSHVAKS